MQRINLGAMRTPMAGARETSSVPGDERFEVSVAMRRNNQAQLDDLTTKLAKGDKSVRTLTRAEFARAFGSTNADRSLVKQFASEYGLAVVSEDVAKATISLSGTAAQFEKAFGISLFHFAYAKGTYRGWTGMMSVPEVLKDVVKAVTGLDNRPVARTRHMVNRTVKAPSLKSAVGPKAKGAKGSAKAKDVEGYVPYFAPQDFAELYNFPDGDGSGQCVALIELGGGFFPQDNEDYFGELGLNVPEIVPVSVDHARNSPGTSDDGADGEVALDIQVVGAVAQGAKIAVYFAPNTDQGFLDCINAAIYDSVNNPSVISISWGAPETLWTGVAMDAMNGAFQAAVALGITVFAASGDNGSTDGLNDGQDHADFPSSSPFVAACGGTKVVAEGGMIVSETVWNNQQPGTNVGGATGGGISRHFDLPEYQTGLTVALTDGSRKDLNMRGTPDVTANADPTTGYLVMVNGVLDVIGGTSAVAPLMAALIAIINSNNRKAAGYIHPVIYKSASNFVPILEGNNGSYAAAQGWSAATGLGRPDGEALQALLK